MFHELGQLASLMGKLPQIKEEMARFQETLGNITVEGDDGAGLIKVRVNGKLEVLSFTLSDKAMQFDDRNALQDLMKNATNQALDRARQQVAEASSKVASSIGLPPGLKTPELS